MQTHGEENLGILGNDILKLVNKSSEPVDFDFSQACRWLSREQLGYRMPHLVVRDITPFSYDYNADDVVLLFSGGRVSLATALKLRSMGKNVKLCYIKDTRDMDYNVQVRKLAQMLNMPLVEYCTYTDPDSMYFGMTLAYYALGYAVRNGYSPKVYMGYFPMASVLNNDRKNWKFCLEFINSFTMVARKYIQCAEIVSIIPSYAVADDEIVRNREFKRLFDTL